MLSREAQLPAYTGPNPSGRVLYKFSPSSAEILSKDRPIVVDGTHWMPVETPLGKGWVDAQHTTEQIDTQAFLEDARPLKLWRSLTKRLRNGRDISSLIASRGLVVALSKTPTRTDGKGVTSLTGDLRIASRSNVRTISHETDDFGISVAEHFLNAFDATSEFAPGASHSKRALIPVELWNFRYLAIQGRNGQPWLLFFEYENGKPRVVGLGIDE